MPPYHRRVLSAPIPAVRERVHDACPGAVTLHEAADGPLARIRIPGGLLEQRQWRALMTASAEVGSGTLQLTSRGNVELRGVRDAAALSRALVAAGLLPSLTHERVRNILASPLSGLDRHTVADITGLVDELDRAIVGAPDLAQLPGRFCFGLDDGRGDITSLQPDLCLLARPDGMLTLQVAELRCVQPLPRDRAVDGLLRAARAFLARAAASSVPAWRIRELPGAARFIADGFGAAETVGDAGVSRPEPYGAVPGSAHLVIGVPLGQVSPVQAEAIDRAAQSAGGLRITPWRSIVVPAVPLAAQAAVLTDLAAAGLATDPRSPWRTVTACAGRPGCSKALSDVRADALAVHSRLPSESTVHWSGCVRRCGRPLGAVVDVLATTHGYEITGPPDDRAHIASAVAAL